MARGNDREAEGGRAPLFAGWLVTAGAFLLTALTCGAFYSFGVFFIPVATEFGWSRGVTSGVVFFMAITYAATVPFTGWLADRFGFRPVMALTIAVLGLGYVLGRQVETLWQMYLFVGLLPGLGAGASVALPLSMVSRWFVRRQGLALGIAAAGIGVGGMVVPLLASHLVAWLGWRQTFYYLGLFFWITCLPVVAFFMRDPDPVAVRSHEGMLTTSKDQGGNIAPVTAFSLLEAIATGPFWLLFLVFLLGNINLGLSMTHLVPYAQDRGLSPVAAAGLLSTMGFFSTVGRLIAGTIADRVGAKPVLYVGLLLQGILMLWLLRAETAWMLYLFAVLVSLSYAGNIVLIPKLCASIFGVASMGAIFGGISVADGLGFAIGPLMAGLIFDASGNYRLSFLLAATGISIGVLLLLLLQEIPAQRRSVRDGLR